MKTFSALFLRSLLACFAFSQLSAQNSDPLVYTVGKTFKTNNGTTLHNFILWQPGDALTTFGKRFAIYAKDGNTTSASPYQRIGVQTLQTAPSAIQALLKLGEKIDADGAMVPELIVGLHAESTGTPMPAGSPMPTEIDLDIARKLGEILTVAVTDPEVLQSLVSLGRAHPGVQMTLGLAWAIETPSSTIKTYEIRELDQISNNDLRVIGRVTLDSANPQELVAPGRPHQMYHPNNPNYQTNASPKDHLTILTRWATPPTLRPLLPHTYGFNLYRIEKSIIDSAPLDPNTLTNASDLLLLGGVRVNRMPVATRNVLTEAEAADPSHLPEIFFYGDDNDAPDPGYQDGDSFYYYVAARDIAGHPGPLSPPTLVMVCDRLPPSTPSIFSVENVFDFDGANLAAGTGQQHLRITIQQVPEEPAENAATSYRVYRWHKATDWQIHGGDPELNFIGEVAHVPGETFVIFDDNNAADIDTDGAGGTGPDGKGGVDTGAPVVTSESNSAMGQTFWYTVRAVDNTACTVKNYSGHCGAMYGVPRDRVGPDQPKGSLISCFCIPRVNLTNEGIAVSRSPYGLDDKFPGFIVRVERTDDKTRRVIKKIKSIDIEYGTLTSNQQGPLFLAEFATTRYFRSLEPFTDVIIPNPDQKSKVIRVRARLGDGSVSPWRQMVAQGTAPKKGEIILYGFRAWVEICCPTLISRNVLREPNGRINERIAAFLPRESGRDDCPAWIETIPGSIPPAHNPIGPDDSITGVCGNIYLDDNIREVRIYRRVGPSGPLQMIARQSGESAIPTPYFWKETAPTLINGMTACYYAQVFDEHANASPLTRIGCVTVINEDLGVPILTDPVNLDPNGSDPIMKLCWFCDPIGVEQFELWVAAEGDVDPAVSASDLGPKIETSSNPVLTDPDDKVLTFSVYRTRTVSSGFGNNGEFCLNLTVPAGKKLFYVIRPIGQQIPNPVTGVFEFATGDFSNIVSDQWVAPPAALQDVIPWPAKPMPGIANVAIDVNQYIPGEGPFYATAIDPAAMNGTGASALILCGTFPSLSNQTEFTYEGFFPGDRDPMEWLFNYRKQSTNVVSSSDLANISPFVVYRYQLPSTRFPDAKPNLVQITPLIDRMAYQKLNIKFDTGNQSVNYDYLRVQDPFFLFQRYDRSFPTALQVPLAGIFSRDPKTYNTGIPLVAAGASLPPYLQPRPSDAPPIFQTQPATIWIRDTLPVARGSSYQYLILTFSSRGEIERVIPTNPISHP